MLTYKKRLDKKYGVIKKISFYKSKLNNYVFPPLVFSYSMAKRTKLAFTVEIPV